MAKETKSITIEKKVVDMIDALCEKENRSFSNLTETVLQQYCNGETQIQHLQTELKVIEHQARKQNTDFGNYIADLAKDALVK